MNRTLITGLVVIVAAFCVVWPGSASDSFGQSGLAAQREAAAKSSLVGAWVADIGKARIALELSEDGAYVLDATRGTYAIAGNVLKLTGEKGEVSYQFEIGADGQLALSGGDLTQPMKFVRQAGVGGYLNRLFDVSWQSILLRFQRILVILLIVAAARLAIFALHLFSRFVIYSSWGPLRFAYVSRKNRAQTIHALALNICKYVIYFIALGFILTELGINYTAYLATLSVLGLAIAFGSQGLVQDMVTGFFIIFEVQFDVGDMVEISGQTGIVEEVGLRMTKLRNYLGQVVVIPNRNIAVVGNYAKGALQTYVDVAVGDPEAAAEQAPLLQQVGDEIARQFDGVILAKPEVLAPFSLQTGEHFVRMHLAVWPQQQWVIDQQLVPRIKEMLTAKGCEIPGDRVVVFYRTGEKLPPPKWTNPLEAIRQRLRRKG